MTNSVSRTNENNPFSCSCLLKTRYEQNKIQERWCWSITSNRKKNSYPVYLNAKNYFKVDEILLFLPCIYHILVDISSDWMRNWIIINFLSIVLLKFDWWRLCRNCLLNSYTDRLTKNCHLIISFIVLC
jgi:superfamily II helicase